MKAAALSVAIPATFGYNILANRLNRLDNLLELSRVDGEQRQPRHMLLAGAVLLTLGGVLGRDRWLTAGAAESKARAMMSVRFMRHA